MASNFSFLEGASSPLNELPLRCKGKVEVEINVDASYKTKKEMEPSDPPLTPPKGRGNRNSCIILVNAKISSS